MKIDIAQQLVAPESGIAVENFAARAEQIANSLGLVADLQRTSGETGEKKKLTGGTRNELRGRD